ncbi:endodeoxyribonuclease RusA [Staphylococcus epidermidis]|uniref:RusA family crossover junction endodeoxyribonuclease n=1 Tax=Staphylococcus epidermidis TaxID=1282 RepID=UPI000E0711F0|nr:RusA family crossover junction endodeoxyribonuclease [Staphylococcus epidermidis]SUM53518.1 endodeoxyribonuclease RusA [Staphylococcus epidermidis]SUM53521.1 endodeoxyribonuclease RusA [Staphylococcus epidermidis]
MANEWSYTIDINPVATPRPEFRKTKNGKTITYYPQKYANYLEKVQQMLKQDQAINENFYNVMRAPLGVKAEVYFYVQAPKKQKKINNIMKTTAPDIDNLVKAAFDSIFKGLKVKDSRIVMVSMAKFQTLTNPRTEITLRGVE